MKVSLPFLFSQEKVETKCPKLGQLTFECWTLVWQFPDTCFGANDATQTLGPPILQICLPRHWSQLAKVHPAHSQSNGGVPNRVGGCCNTVSRVLSHWAFFIVQHNQLTIDLAWAGQALSTTHCTRVSWMIRKLLTYHFELLHKRCSCRKKKETPKNSYGFLIFRSLICWAQMERPVPAWVPNTWWTFCGLQRQSWFQCQHA